MDISKFIENRKVWYQSDTSTQFFYIGSYLKTLVTENFMSHIMYCPIKTIYKTINSAVIIVFTNDIAYICGKDELAGINNYFVMTHDHETLFKIPCDYISNISHKIKEFK